MRFALLLLVLSISAPLARAQPAPATIPKPEETPPLDPAGLRKALADNPSGPAAVALIEKLRKWFGAEPLKNGMAAKTDGLDAAFAIEVAGAKAVTARAANGSLRLPLAQLPGSDVWAGVHTLGDGTALRFAYDVDGRRVGAADVETYALLPDSLPQPGVPKGKVIQQKRWVSKIYGGAERDWWIYVPAQYRAQKPAAVMVFQDGHQYVKQVPVVFDNLIHRGDMPITAGIFLTPGVYPDGKRNRGVEYDTLSDTYARFLLEEILPEAEKTVKLRRDPESRAIGGLSSGAACAFTVAWERPDQFRKVLSWIGSYTNIAAGASGRDGAHNYPALVRRTRKPIRVFLQAGEQDLEQEAGSWTLANRTMESGLTYAAWDFRMVWGRGFHSPKHGFAILPDSLRWLWRDHKGRP